MKLNLETNSKEQELIKAYLEENASETLAEKINNGIQIEKDGKTLIIKKTLDGFMKFASQEAKKLASKGANSACIEDKVVYGWAIHFFEEDSIEGSLYNLDGSEYKPENKQNQTSTNKTSLLPEKPKPKPQISLFEFMQEQQSTDTEEKPAIDEIVSENFDDEYEEEPTKDDIQEIMEEIAKEEKRWINDTTYVDDDGVIHETENQSDEEPPIDKSAFDLDALCKLDEIFGDILTLR